MTYNIINVVGYRIVYNSCRMVSFVDKNVVGICVDDGPLLDSSDQDIGGINLYSSDMTSHLCIFFAAKIAKIAKNEYL